MAQVEVKNDGKTIEVPDGSLLAELDGKCSILFACKAGACGSCKVKVVEGMENLEPPDDVEKQGLATFGTADNERLLCVAKIKGGKVVGGQAVGAFADSIGLFMGAMWRRDDLNELRRVWQQVTRLDSPSPWVYRKLGRLIGLSAEG